jgi:hypothetical protein
MYDRAVKVVGDQTFRAIVRDGQTHLVEVRVSAG